jgi:P27 family predicted phage terminase small subunit
MGKRGPAPMPTKLKILHGEKRKARLNHDEPQPRANLPKRPSDLSDEAASVWRRIMRDFGATGVITAVDADALRAYCEAVVRYQYAAKKLEESGPLVRGQRSGELVKNPLHQIVRDNADLLRQFARELGLTPSARTGLHVGKGGELYDPLTEWEQGAAR